MKSVIKGVLLFLAGVLLGVTLVHKARGAEETGYRIAALKASLKKALKGDKNWKACGKYFAGAETTRGKFIYFSFEEKSPNEISTAFVVVSINRVTIAINEKVGSPTVIVLGNDEKNTQFILRMKMKDYKIGLPCLSRGMEV